MSRITGLSPSNPKGPPKDEGFLKTETSEETKDSATRIPFDDR